jgi:glycosyltransferase involved in cell wall biosynthesis
LYVIDSLAPGGAERSLVALAPALDERGVHLEVAHLRPEAPLAAALRERGVRVHAVGGQGRVAWTRAAASLIRARGPAIVHTTLFEADQAGRVAARLARVPVVSSLVNVPYGPEQRADRSLSSRRLMAAQTLDTLTSRLVTRFHAITDTVAVAMSDRLHIPPGRIDVIPRARDDAALGRRSAHRAAEARRRLGLAPDQPLVLAAARHEWQKGLDVLIRAWSSTHEGTGARLVIAGRRGNRTAELEALVADAGLDPEATLLGARDDVPDLLAAADVFVVPSRWEGFGSVLVEAMALEAPIVAADIPAIREVVRDGHEALLVPAGDPTALGRAIVGTLTDRTGAARRADAARRRFLERFEIGPVADQTVAFYERALADRRARSSAGPHS